MLDALTQDVRHAVRTLRKRPGFAVAAILTLALGIGANGTVFSVINAVLLQPLPFPDGDRLMEVAQVQPRSAEGHIAPVRPQLTAASSEVVMTPMSPAFSSSPIVTPPFSRRRCNLRTI